MKSAFDLKPPDLVLMTNPFILIIAANVNKNL